MATIKRRKVTCVRNAQGCKVKQWCGSCRHKSTGKHGERLCLLMTLAVEQRFGCDEWAMSEALKKAGDSKRAGRVKRRAYLEYVMKVRLEEQEAEGLEAQGQADGLEAQGQADGQEALTPRGPMTIEALRRRFEKETGLSPYLDF